MPFLSVVIPTYNRAHCVCEAIDSVLAQSYHDFELIVVDDGSMDNTAKVITKYEGRIRYIRQKNSGVSCARNKGILSAQSEWIAFLDSDDVWVREKLSTQVKSVEKHPEVVAHLVDALIELPSGQCVSLFEMRNMRDEYSVRPYRARPLRDVLSTQFFTQGGLFKRQALIAAGCFNKAMRINEDYDMLTRLALLGPFIISCMPGVIIRRRQNTESALSDLHVNSKLESLTNKIQTFSNLMNDSRLNKEEKMYVRRQLSGVRHETALFHRAQRNWPAYLSNLGTSVREDLGIRSIARATTSLMGVYGILIKYLENKRGHRQFRRSELEAQYRAKDQNSID